MEIRLLIFGDMNPKTIEIDLANLLIEERNNDEIIDTLSFEKTAEYVWVGTNATETDFIHKEYCNRNNIPIIHGLSRGSAYIVPSNNLGFSLVMKETKTLNVYRAFELFMQSLLNALSFLNGVSCKNNDILVKGRRISSSSSGRFGKVIYLETSINLDFNYNKANAILTEKGKKNKILRNYITSIKHETTASISRDFLISQVVKGIEDTFKATIKIGELTEKEKAL